MIYRGFEGILVPENNRKQNPIEVYTNKHRQYFLKDKTANQCVLVVNLAGILHYTWVRVLYIILLTVCSNKVNIAVMRWKNILTKSLWWLKIYDENFENFTKYWLCGNGYIDGNNEVGDHCHITGNSRGSALRDCNTRLKLNRKISSIFHNLKNYNSYLVIQELAKLNFIPNRLEKIYEL